MHTKMSMRYARAVTLTAVLSFVRQDEAISTDIRRKLMQKPNNKMVPPVRRLPPCTSMTIRGPNQTTIVTAAITNAWPKPGTHKSFPLSTLLFKG